MPALFSTNQSDLHALSLNIFFSEEIQYITVRRLRDSSWRMHLSGRFVSAEFQISNKHSNCVTWSDSLPNSCMPSMQFATEASHSSGSKSKERSIKKVITSVPSLSFFVSFLLCHCDQTQYLLSLTIFIQAHHQQQLLACVTNISFDHMTICTTF